MKKYGVKELAKLSGVSVRTLHYYDKIGLLNPIHRTNAGYRYYGMDELYRLQQILFYKELDFPLKDIHRLLEDSNHNLIEALYSHKKALIARKKRISILLKTIDNTIEHLKKGSIMSKPEILYKGLPKEFGTTYREEAIAKYGRDKVEKVEQELMKMGQEGYQQLIQEQVRISEALFELRNVSPDSEPVQKLIAQHYIIIRRFWGSHGQEDPQTEGYAGLGDLYVNDERFTKIKGVPQPEYARFMQKAMRIFVDTQ